MKAVDKFDYCRGFKFSTYDMVDPPGDPARHRRFRLTIRMPVHAVEALGQIERARRKLHDERGRQPTISEMRRRRDAHRQSGLLLRLGRTPYSLETPLADDLPPGDVQDRGAVAGGR
jgi:RNA polymerase primary sigma factor